MCESGLKQSLMNISITDVENKIACLEQELINLRRVRDSLSGKEPEIGRLFRSAEGLGIKEADIFSRNRQPRVVFARCVIGEHLRRQGLSGCQIGRVMRRDHATVWHWHKMYDNAVSEPRFYRDLVTFINDFETQLDKEEQ